MFHCMLNRNFFSTQDEPLEISEEFQKPMKVTIGESDRLEVYFCPEIKALEKGPYFVPTLDFVLILWLMTETMS